MTEETKKSRPRGGAKRKPPFPITSEDREMLVDEIAATGGAEVLSAATLGEGGRWVDLRVLARGTADAAPAVLRGLRAGDILLHNHPDGRLQPSEADLGVAYLCGQSGIGFAIHDNACTTAYVVVEPPAPEGFDPLDRDAIVSLLHPRGAIFQKLEGHEERPGQIGLMESVIDALNTPCHAILEGETGVGKSLAYLIPALFFAHQRKCRVAVSTNTLNLQSQLCGKDLPFLLKHMPFPFTFALMKGRSNYLCRRRMAEMESPMEGEVLLDADELDEYLKLRAWAKKTSDGSLGDLTWEPKDSLWEKVCADKDACLHIRCSEFKHCFFFESRRKAAEADLLVVNHNLLFSDLAFRAESREYSQVAVLPAYKAVVLDEAHNLEEIATRHFGHQVTGFGMQRMLGRLYHKRGRREGGVLSVLLSRLLLGAGPFATKLRETVANDIQEKILPLRTEVADRSRELFDGIQAFVIGEKQPYFGEHRIRLTPRQAQMPAFADLAERAFRLRDDLGDLARLLRRLHKRLTDALTAAGEVAPEEEAKGGREFEMPLTELNGFGGKFQKIQDALDLLFNPETPNRDRYVHFFSVAVRQSGKYPSMNSFPIVVSDVMVENCFSCIPTAVLVSATLTARKSFEFMKSRLGLDSEELLPEPIEGRFPSPFDYKDQARLFIPIDLPDPASPDFIERTVEPVGEIVRTSQGGALVLCTSYRHLKHLSDKLSPDLENEGLLCMKQGDASRDELLRRFREDGNAVLFATESFWEGIDVPGNALRNLVIAKLPFAIPDDPILEARQEMLKAEGKNAFSEYQLPMAAIKLKQGFGRLIRHREDRGTVWILDRRLVTKSYGAYFLESLPPAPFRQGPVETLLPHARAFFERPGCRLR
ncbi:MAG TPA: helicase C-terminal domain-containing protein [Candidatus Ozemobacteraceae bacterium]|nr:helicase C-terminal domain-containing protein [Candidatus Ozemobacteraceae bacterium]